MKKTISVLGFVALFMDSCGTYGPVSGYTQPEPTVIDYANLTNWAAHPETSDNADLVPGKEGIFTGVLEAYVFFIHPTIYNDRGKDLPWNPRLDNIELNERIDNSTIKFQATAFNGSGRVFAPRYRQAHLVSYRTADTASAKKAFALAYSDVKQAFEYYLMHYNKGRPIIIAGHSQGTTHGAPLVREFFDGTPLQGQLVAAYLIGLPLPKTYFEHIKPCTDKDDLGCSISWRTFKRGYLPKDRALGDSILVTNPLSWKIDSEYVPKSANSGAVLRNFEQVLQQRVDAQVHQGILWANKPRFPWSFLLTRKNYHIADINFYYQNIKENAAHRVKRYLEREVKASRENPAQK